MDDFFLKKNHFYTATGADFWEFSTSDWNGTRQLAPVHDDVVAMLISGLHEAMHGMHL